MQGYVARETDVLPRLRPVIRKLSQVHFWTVSVAQRREAFSLSGHSVHFRSRDRTERIHLPLPSPQFLPTVFLQGIESYCVSLFSVLSSSVSQFTLVA